MNSQKLLSAGFTTFQSTFPLIIVIRVYALFFFLHFFFLRTQDVFLLSAFNKGRPFGKNRFNMVKKNVTLKKASESLQALPKPELTDMQIDPFVMSQRG